MLNHPRLYCNHFENKFLHFRILALEKLGAVFNQVSHPLQHTPRKFVIHPETNNLIVIETEYNAYTEATKMERKQQMAEVGLASSDIMRDKLCVGFVIKDFNTLM